MQDLDPVETQEWLDALESVLDREGEERVHYLLARLGELAARSGTRLPYSITTPFRNTIPVSREARMPGDLFMERRIRSLVRWNALAMVVKTNHKDSSLGGHISTFASSATLYDVGFNYFFRAPNEKHGGDLVYFQGHASPGIYARAFLEGRLSEEQLTNFRQEVDGNGLPSYPHPHLFPEFWQFPTVSMGLGPIQAIYQARFMRYLENRGFIPPGQRVWCFVGDGECDEPETLGAISLAGREKLDNLVFVVNCNLQRLDGPVRGDGHIIQELEGIFRGADWNVLKVVWGRMWDPLFAEDVDGRMQRRMDEVVDGEYQNYKAKDGAYVRKHFFGADPELLKRVEKLSDDEIWKLNRGGHDPYKVYAAYQAAVNHKDQPSVVLALTIKGYGVAGESQNTAHNTKKVDIEALKVFRDRFDIPFNDEQLKDLPFYRPDPNSPEAKYLHKRREALGGYLPQRRTTSVSIPTPSLEAFAPVLDGSGEREISTTMAFGRVLAHLVKDKEVGKRVVPILADEARTFGMEGMFRQLGIYAPFGQLYEPVDRDQVMYYREATDGQILQEGLTEAGAFSSWIAAGTAYSNYNTPMLPIYIYYSMFGFQRIGDLAWAAGDCQARGFLLGGTSGRTTLNGEGLQHEDGHSHILAGTIPNCRSYDPTYGYELAVIMAHGTREMLEKQYHGFFYITVMNENYQQPAMPKGKKVEEGIIKGMYLLEEGKGDFAHRVQLLGSGSILREVRAAKELLAEFGVLADVWSVTSFNELRRDGLETDRWNRLHPAEKPRKSFVQKNLDDRLGPVIASTDYIKLFADQIRPWVRGEYEVLGTDGFGRSDTRAKLRDFFEVDRRWVTLSALYALLKQGGIEAKVVAEAIAKFGIDPEKPNPLDC